MQVTKSFQSNHSIQLLSKSSLTMWGPKKRLVYSILQIYFKYHSSGDAYNICRCTWIFPCLWPYEALSHTTTRMRARIHTHTCIKLKPLHVLCKYNVKFSIGIGLVGVGLGSDFVYLYPKLKWHWAKILLDQHKTTTVNLILLNLNRKNRTDKIKFN